MIILLTLKIVHDDSASKRDLVASRSLSFVLMKSSECLPAKSGLLARNSVHCGIRVASDHGPNL